MLNKQTLLEKLNILKNFMEKATPYPWQHDGKISPDDVSIWYGSPRTEKFVGNIGERVVSQVGVIMDQELSDAEFIVACRNILEEILPSLIEGIKILNKVAELSESPFSKLFSLLFSNRCSKALKVLKTDSSLSVFSNLNNFFGYYVVSIFLKVSFFAREFFEVSFGRFSASLLKRGLNFGHFPSGFINLISGKELTIACSQEINYPYINSKNSFRFEWSTIWEFYTNTKKKIAFLVKKICLTPNSSLFKFGIGTENNGDLISTINTKNTNGVKPPKGKNSLIVYKGRMFLKFMQGFLFSAIRFFNLSNSSHCHLRGKPIGIAYIPITEMVKSYLSKLLLLKSNLGDVITSIIKNLNSSNERGFLFRCWKKFNLNCKFHNCIVTYYQYVALHPMLYGKIVNFAHVKKNI